MDYFLKLYNSQVVSFNNDIANLLINFYTMKIVRFKSSK